MKTNHTLAPRVANEMSARCAWIDAEKMYSLDCSEADFAEVLALIEKEYLTPTSNVNRAAYDRLQNEGCSEPKHRHDPVDEFDGARD